MNAEQIKTQYSEFIIRQIIELENEIHLKIETKNDKAVCPFCGYPSTKIHQRYSRVIQDLPINKKDVSLFIKCKVFRCENNNCNHFSFNEPLDTMVPNEKKTQRLIQHIVKLSKQNTCRGVAKDLNDQGLKISKATVNNIYNKYK